MPPGIPLHLEYADDIDFFTKPDADLERIKTITRETLEKYGLTINSEKTEVAIYDGQSNLQKVKKLGTILDEKTEWNRRKQLSSLAMSKYRPIWKNKFIPIKRKMKIYNTYIRSILTYNCSTWTSNKTINKKHDSFHRKQLKRAINIFTQK